MHASVDLVLRRCLGTPGSAADWVAAVRRIDAHGLAPLAHARIEALGLTPPSEARRTLGVLALLHQARSARQRGALVELLRALDRAGVQPFVLKGAALAHLVYDDPSHRPMGDLDLLVRPAESGLAASVLAELGFGPRPGARPDGRHTAFVRDQPGGTGVVELHDNLFPPGHRLARQLDRLTAEPLVFAIDGTPARTLGPAATLEHLCAHLVGHADVFTPLRLVWALDVLLWADRYGAAPDETRLARTAPYVPAVLSLLSRLDGAGGPLDFDGWPRQGLAAQRGAGKGLGRIADDTLRPPGWWLRLHHGLEADRPLVWHRWVKHPIEIGGLVARHVGERLGRGQAA